jgi:N12 class adenine-specific DNA methylase
MGILYANLDPWVRTIINDMREQLLEPGIINIFGRMIPFDVKHKPLAKQALEAQRQPQAMGMDPGMGGMDGGMGMDPNADPMGGMNDGSDPSMGQDPTMMGLDVAAAVGEGVLSAAELVKAAKVALQQPQFMSAKHAPKGYTKENPLVIDGHEYYGGMFIPGEVLAKASEQQRQEIESGKKTGTADSKQKAPDLQERNTNHNRWADTLRRAHKLVLKNGHKVQINIARKAGGKYEHTIRHYSPTKERTDYEEKFGSIEEASDFAAKLLHHHLNRGKLDAEAKDGLERESKDSGPREPKSISGRSPSGSPGSEQAGITGGTGGSDSGLSDDDGRLRSKTGADANRSGDSEGSDSGTGQRSTLRDSRGVASNVEAIVTSPPTPETPTDLAAGNFRYTTNEFLKGGLKTKFRQNIAALQTMRMLQEEGRQPTPEEAETLSKFVGWGQFPALFNNPRAYDDESQERDEEQLKYDPDFKKQDWDKERKLLRSILTDEEFETTKGSILNAHYTHPDVVQAHWDIARKLGFNGGRFLETSAGIGYYLGMMPSDLAGRTHTTAVELEKTTGAMLKQLYPSTNVQIKGFEKFQSPDNFFGLVGSNVPFGAYQVADPRYDRHQAYIHDYFFLKSADVAQPGGLIMHITSTGTMDKPDDKIRKLLADKCEFVAAVRFPTGMHQENAGTSVVTDMVILRKRIPGEQPVTLENTPSEADPKQPGFTGITVDSLGRLYHWKDGKRVPGPDWTQTTQVPDPDGGEPITINKYFAEHPENILGRLDRSATMRSAEEKGVSAASPEELSEALGRPVRVDVDPVSKKRRLVFEDGTPVSAEDRRRVGRDQLRTKLAKFIDNLPEGVYHPVQNSKQAFIPESMPAPDDVREGGYRIIDGKLFQRVGGGLVQREANKTQLARIEGQLAILAAGRAAINTQLKGEDASKDREALNQAYDKFVAQFGPINDRANTRAMQDSGDDQFFLRSLENYNAGTKQAKKADIFFKDTVRHTPSLDKVDNVSDAIGVSFHEFGGVNIEHIAKITGKTIEQAGRELSQSGIAFEDPSAGWQQAAVYLSGNVRQKLIAAKAAAEADPKFQVNVDALSKVQPEDKDISEISVNLGAAWLPPSDVAQFAADTLNTESRYFQISHSTLAGGLGGWKAKWSSEGQRRYSSGRIYQTQQWDTHGVGFIKLLEAALTGRKIEVKGGIDEYTDETGTHQIRAVDADGNEVVNRKATNDVAAKVQELKDKFGDWVWSDDDRAIRLARYFNDNFNNIRDLQIDGSHQTFPGMNPAIKLHPHIPNFVWQVVTNGTALAAHEVGMGKTYAMIASAMELRRLGLAKKPCIACLKANIEQITRDAQLLYPGARILSTQGNMTAKKRKELVSRMATGDYDLVIMTHDNLNMLKMRPEVEAQYMRDEIAEMESAKNAAEGEGGKDGRNRAKQIETAIKNLKVKLERILTAAGKDDAVAFEDTGIDQLFVDEAHYYKTLPTYSKQNRVKGIPQGRSQRATTMLMRCRYLQEHNGGRGVVFATGTPLDNTMAELYTMQRYLQPNALAERGISNFDDWASVFGSIETRHNFNVAGEYKPTDRFSKFVNVPELMAMARQVIDVQRADDLKLTPAQAAEINDPSRPAGSPVILRPKKFDQETVSPKHPAIEALMGNLQERAKALSGKRGQAEKGEDNMLVICTDGRKGAVDLRLLDDNAPDLPNSKTNQCVRNVLRLSRENPGFTQLIFSDVGVNPSTTTSRAAEAVVSDDAESEERQEEDEDITFNEEFADANLGSTGSFRLYDDIIDKLVAGGIPREKIADFSALKGQAKEDAMDKMRRGEILVAIGSTKKLGTGCNVQNKVMAMHHLDVPWTPSALEQRVGRGFRHGNELAKLGKPLLNIPYIQEGSLDSFFWQTVSTKAKFINQVMAGKSDAREIADADTETVTPDQLMAIASGNPLTMEKVELEDAIKRLRQGQQRHIREQTKTRELLSQADKSLPEMQSQLERHKADLAHFASRPDFEMKIGETTYSERKAAEEALASRMTEIDHEAANSDEWDRGNIEPIHIGEYRGVPLHYKPAEYFPSWRSRSYGKEPWTEKWKLSPIDHETRRLFLDLPSGDKIHSSSQPSLKSIEYSANMQKRADDQIQAISAQEANKASLQAKIGQKFAKQEELEKKQQRLREVEAALTGNQPESEDNAPKIVQSTAKLEEAERLRRRLAELEQEDPALMNLAPGTVRTFNGRQYTLNQHHRWQRSDRPQPSPHPQHVQQAPAQTQQHPMAQPGRPMPTFDPGTGQKLPVGHATQSAHASARQPGDAQTSSATPKPSQPQPPKPTSSTVSPHPQSSPSQPQSQTPSMESQLETIDQITQRDAAENYEQHKAKYLQSNGMYDAQGNLQGVVLNTDEWRTNFPQYVGTNAADVHEASSYLNKRLYSEALSGMKGKGNNRMLILAGGGGSGKGTATGLYYNQQEYPIVLDQASDSYPKLEQKLDDAIANGYKPLHVFIDRGPESALTGIAKRAMGLHKRGELPRTVPANIAFEANIKARKATLELLKRRHDVEVHVVDNRSDNRGEKRLITDRNEAIKYLEQRVAEEDQNAANGLEDRLHRNVAHRYLAGDIPEAIAKGLTSPEYIEEAKKWIPPYPTQQTQP